MAINPLGLGKGLDALIRETSEARETSGVQTLPLKDIQPNPNQPRRKFNEKALEELAASITSQGILQPLLVRPLGPGHPGKYEIVAGERRWRASKLAGLVEVPVLIRSFSAQDTLAAALIENLQREDLNPVEEALGIQTLKDEFGLSQEDLAKRLGKSRSAIANSLRLLTLPESFRKDLAEGRISAGHARSLLSITEPRAQEYLRNLILEEHLSVREAEGLAATWKETGEFKPEVVVGGAGGASGAKEQATTEEPQHEEGKKGDEDAAAEEHTDIAPAVAKKGMPQSARIMEIQNRIGAVLSMPVRVTGKETKGKISLSYNSKEELDLLLDRLSQLALEGGNYPALAGTSRDALESKENPALAGSASAALTSTEHVALAGTEQKQLDQTHAAALSGQNNLAIEGREEPGVLEGAPHHEALTGHMDESAASLEEKADGSQEGNV